jgi:hypothetical protein
VNWRKIAALSLLLAALAAAIVIVSRRERSRQGGEGILLDIPADAVERIELHRRGESFVFSRQDVLWRLDAPLAAKADRAAVESILDNFCRLRYDRLVAAKAVELKDFGLDRPEIELLLSAKGRPLATVLLGMKNVIDGSSYAKLAGDGRVVSIAAYGRNDLEKDLFAFRDKAVLELDSAAVQALDFRRGNSALAFARKEGRWFLEKPIYSLAQESKVEEILAAAAGLQARSFAPLLNSGGLGAFGLDKPELIAEFRSPSGMRRFRVGRQGKGLYAMADGAGEACAIDPDLLDKFAADPALFRERKVAPFFAFDVSEIAFRGAGFAFTARKDAAGSWRLEPAPPGKKASREKIENLLSALAGLEAKEFIDAASVPPPFTTRIALKTVDPTDPEKQTPVVIEIAAGEGETAIVRNPALPYWFRVDRQALPKLPAGLDDVCEAPAGRPLPKN